MSAKEVSATDIDKLRGMLGAREKNKKNWGYRNYFACGGNDRESMERLVSAGLATRGAAYENEHYYHATEAGCDKLGFDAAAKKRAFEP